VFILYNRVASQKRTPENLNVDDTNKQDVEIKRESTLQAVKTEKSETIDQNKRFKLQLPQKLDPKSVRKNVQGYVFTRYFDYIKNYQDVLEQKFPSAVKVYRIFIDGVKYFYNDMKRYLKITKLASESPQGLKILNRKELELYIQMPRDMFKVAPALMICSLPMVGYGAMALV